MNEYLRPSCDEDSVGKLVALLAKLHMKTVKAIEDFSSSEVDLQCAATQLSPLQRL